MLYLRSYVATTVQLHSSAVGQNGQLLLFSGGFHKAVDLAPHDMTNRDAFKFERVHKLKTHFLSAGTVILSISIDFRVFRAKSIEICKQYTGSIPSGKTETR